VVFAPHKHIPLASLSPEIAQKTITFNSPSKTFNIAGLTTAYAIIPNHSYHKRYNLQLERNGTHHGNIFGYEALKASYTPNGVEWLKQMLDYVGQSLSITRDYLKINLPKIKLIEPEGTYLLWLDFREYNLSTETLNKKLIHEAEIGFNSGEIFGKEGTGFQRMNIGCQHSIVKESLDRLKKVF
jgi:cystathionine beta-lyase